MQRRGVADADLGPDPVIQRGDVLHCDVGITVARLNTDTQHLAYVLREGETDAPPGLRQALANANAMQDVTLEELRPGRSGNAVLASTLTRTRAKGIDGSQYSHPIGLHGHGAGPLIGLWDYQDGVPGRGDALVIPGMWYSIELQATTPVAEWGGQRRPHGPGRGRDHRRRRAGPLGAEAAGPAVPGEVIGGRGGQALGGGSTPSHKHGAVDLAGQVPEDLHFVLEQATSSSRDRTTATEERRPHHRQAQQLDRVRCRGVGR